MTVKPPRMTPMSWADTRQALDSHAKAISQLYGNCDALKDAIDGEIVDGKLVSRAIVAIQAVTNLSFWGRLKWLLTGRVV